MEIRVLDPKGFFARGRLALAAISALTSLALLCTGCAEPGYGGTKLCGTEIPDPWEVAGCADLEGGEPAIAARVVAYPTASGQAKGSSAGVSKAISDSFVVETESHGLFRFPSLPPGEYDLYIEDTAYKNLQGWQVHRQPKIRVKVGGKQTLPTYQLRTAGLFTLSVVDEKNDSPIEGAVCRIDGTPYQLPVTDAIGTSFIYLPASDSSDLYRVSCRQSPYSENSLYFEINSDTITSRRMKMSMGASALPIPKPLNVVSIEDTATGIVRVTWSKPVSTELFEYVVKRNEVDNPALSKIRPVGGDSVDYDPVFAGEPDSVIAKTLLYSVACVRRNGGAGDWAYGKQFTAVRGPSVELKYLDTASSSCMAGDTIRIVGRYSSRFHFMSRVSWTLKGEPDTLRTFEVSDRSGADALSFPCKDPGDVPVELQLRVKDETGVTAIGRIPVLINSGP